ncbi:MAG: hypothetical protein ABI047_18590 [Jatrophihabitantaceae bacterium]
MTARDEGTAADAAPQEPDHRYVAVIGPRSAGPELCRIAYEVGVELARRRAVLLCGGLTGVMEAAARGAREASPRCWTKTGSWWPASGWPPPPRRR